MKERPTHRDVYKARWRFEHTLEGPVESNKRAQKLLAVERDIKFSLNAYKCMGGGFHPGCLNNCEYYEVCREMRQQAMDINNDYTEDFIADVEGCVVIIEEDGDPYKCFGKGGNKLCPDIFKSDMECEFDDACWDAMSDKTRVEGCIFVVEES
jgi:hypothetical protein